MWQQHMQSDCVTQVLICNGTIRSTGLAPVMEFLTALQKLCATYSCALSINGQTKPDGTLEFTLHTLLLKDQVSALIANHEQLCRGYIVVATNVPPAALGNTNVVMRQLRHLRVNHGH